MIDPKAHEAAVSLFFEPHHRVRRRALMKAGRRTRALQELSKRVDLDPRYQVEVHGRDSASEAICYLLKLRGASDTCYVVSTDEELDGRAMDLLSAIEAADGRTTILSCIPGRLGYFKSHERDRYILERSE